MAQYAVELKVINSGSPNDLPCSGAASECYLSIGYFSPDSSSMVSRTTLFVNDIGNNRSYSDFVDLNTNERVNLISLPDDDSGVALVVTLSVYWGSRLFDKLLACAAEQAIDTAFGNACSAIAGPVVGWVIKDQLKAFEKGLTAQLKESIASIVVTVGTEVFEDLGSQMQDESVTLRIKSKIDVKKDFPELDVIREGDLAAEVVLRRVG